MKLLYSALLLLISLLSSATHNRAGEILYRRISDLEYEITVVTYTDIQGGQNADRCELSVDWGDGSPLEVVPRVNGGFNGNCFQGEEIIPGVTKKNIYIATHTYSSPGTYLVGMLDQNRNANVQNIPGSVNVPFYIESVIKIAPGLGANSSPILLNAPIDEACVGLIFEHNPGAYDPDGDSLSYKLVSSLQGHMQPVTGYTMPDASVSIDIDPVTGDLVWDSPVGQGEFNIAIEISEWRNGQIISRILRDMQVLVAPCNNLPPKINPIPDICVKAGEQLTIPITATDPDTDNSKNLVKLEVTGGPFELNQPANFNQGVSNNGTVTSNLTWGVRCQHVRKAAYQITVKATNEVSSIHGPDLVDYYSFNITVLSPGPDSIAAEVNTKSILVKWKPNPCPEATGYKLFRKKSAQAFNPGECEVGIPAYLGYEEIADLSSLSDTSYLDNDGGKGLEVGIMYCYRVYAYFEDGSKSFASPEICARLRKEAPAITQVDILNTSLSNGEIYLEWAKPTEYDTVLYQGPFEYRIYQAEGLNGGNPVQIASNAGINDTTLTVSNLNTEELAYHFVVELMDLGQVDTVGVSDNSSSVRLDAAGAGNRVLLSWQEDVTWVNNEYYIYRYDDLSAQFVLIDSTENAVYTDLGLQNGEEYCYKIESKGQYTVSGYKRPLLNFSQERCAIPIDTVPPCKPILDLLADCEQELNEITWSVLYDASCENDVDEYRLYYKETQDGDYQLIYTSNDPLDTSFTHQGEGSIAGCYYVEAIDSNGNVSAPSDAFCTDNCPVFELPNVFSPNGDNINDIYQPLSSKYVDRIEISIYNRWGSKVFETTEPNINWDGTNMLTGELCSEGVYFYDCKVFEKRLSGIEIRNLGGYIHLFTGK